MRYRKVTLPPAESVDIRAGLASFRVLLGGLDSGDRQKIANALAEAESDAAQPEADKDEIGEALERVLRHARNAAACLQFGSGPGGVARRLRALRRVIR